MHDPPSAIEVPFKHSNWPAVHRVYPKVDGGVGVGDMELSLTEFTLETGTFSSSSFLVLVVESLSEFNDEFNDVSTDSLIC